MHLNGLQPDFRTIKRCHINEYGVFRQIGISKVAELILTEGTNDIVGFLMGTATGYLLGPEPDAFTPKSDEEVF